MSHPTLEDVLAEENLRAAWRQTPKTSHFAVLDAGGREIANDRDDLASALGSAPVSSPKELLADVSDLCHIGGGHGHDWDLTAEPVSPIDIDGREVFGHCIRARVLQRAYVRVVGPVLDGLLPPVVFSYRPHRDRITALLAARRWIRRDNVFVAKVDVRRFFPGITMEQVSDALGSLVPGIDDSLRRLAAWFCTAPIVRPGPTFEPALNALYQGSIVAPLLSNAVGALHLDAPFQCFAAPGVRYLRYADDILLLGPTFEAVTAARDVVVELIETAGWKAHPEKTFDCAHDLRDSPITFLGKTVGVSGISTPRDKIQERLDAFVSLAPNDPLVETMAAALAMELFLDPRVTVDSVVAEAGVHGPRYGRLLRRVDAHLGRGRKTKMRAFDVRLAPLFAL